MDMDRAYGLVDGLREREVPSPEVTEAIEQGIRVVIC